MAATSDNIMKLDYKKKTGCMISCVRVVHVERTTFDLIVAVA